MVTSDVVMSGAQLKKLISRKVEPLMQEYDLRPVELDILVFLQKEKSVDTAKGIIEKKHLSKAHISKSIENLRAGGFIQIAEDENDRRILHINLTDKSNEVIRKVNEIYTQCKEIMERGISKEDLEILRKVIAQVNENINRELEE
ncbi:MAG: winged helix DNA-binding protein [Lachnospiraceae bacterium]|nr:winged helix DNA-binding protein [Lachnospiraceae bacterium]